MNYKNIPKVLSIVFGLVCLQLKSTAQIDIPVDALSGRASISIPLGQIVNRDIVVPISLNYNSSGLKVAGWTTENQQYGRNWNLQAEYKITRTMKGLPDEFSSTLKKGWLKGSSAANTLAYTISADKSVSTCVDEQGDFINLSSMVYTDTEPDEFQFQLPGGYSGKFLFDNNGVVRTQPYNDLKIVADLDLGTIDITTNDGKIYYFRPDKHITVLTDPNSTEPGTLKREYLIYKPESPSEKINYVTSWHLAGIVSPIGGNVQFNYKQTTYSSPDTAKNHVVFGSEHNVMDTLYTLCTLVDYDHQFIGVTGSNTLAISNSSTGKTISFSGYGLPKEYALNVIEVTSLISATGTATRQMKFLRSIKEITNCSAFPPYELDYYGVNWTDSTTYFPPEDSFGQDIWGYNNGEISYSSLYPELYVYSASAGAGKYKLAPLQISGYSSIIAGNPRLTDATAIVYGALKTMKFPSGGKGDLEYEPNDFYDPISSSNVQGMGLRVKKVTLNDGMGLSNDQITEYTYKVSGQSTGVITTNLPSFLIAGVDSIYRSTTNISGEPELRYNQTSIIQPGRGKIVYQFNNPASYPSISYTNPLSTAYNWNASYAQIIRDGCATEGGILTGENTFPFGPNPDYDFERGQLKKQQIYDESGTLIKEYQYDYEHLTPALITIKGIKYEYVDGIILASEYNTFANAGTNVSVEREYTRNPATSAMVLSSQQNSYYESANHLLLTRTTKSNSDGSLMQKKFKYAADYAGISTPVDEYTAALKWMDTNFIRSSIVEIIESLIKGSTEIVKSAQLTTFKKFGALEALQAQSLSYVGAGTFTPSSIQSVSGGQKFTYDAAYKADRTVLSYNNYNPSLITEKSTIKTAYLTDLNDDLPRLIVENADLTQIAYSDFDKPWANSFDVLGGAVDGTGYTGNFSVQITSGLIKSIVKAPVQSYRVSFWYNTSTTEDMYYIVSSQSGGASDLFTLGATGGKWKFFEKTIDVSSILDNEMMEINLVSVSGTGIILMDNVAFYPSNAKITILDYIPRTGKKYEMDGRGVAMFYEYDSFGRLNYIKDQDKNILKVIEYNLLSQPAPSIKSDFNANISSLGFTTDSQADFISWETCFSNASHAWYINGVLVSTSANYSYTVPSTVPLNPVIEVKHIVSHPIYGSSETVKNFRIITRTLNMQILLAGGSPVINTCDVSYKRTFVASYYGCPPETTMTFLWEIRLPGQPWTTMSSTNYWTEACGAEYSIRCTISGCGLTTMSNELKITKTGSCPEHTCPD